MTTFLIDWVEVLGIVALDEIQVAVGERQGVNIALGRLIPTGVDDLNGQIAMD